MLGISFFTTARRIVTGLHLPDTRRMLWDGVDAATADRDQLSAPSTVLEQSFQQPPLALRADVLIGRPERSDDPALPKRAADYADLHPIIDAQDNGWDTLAATAGADLIHVLHEGRPAEQGTHAQPMAGPNSGQPLLLPPPGPPVRHRDPRPAEHNRVRRRSRPTTHPKRSSR
ncbi:hypothetical protein [Kitasatospora sp. NPDC094016]|uniref:hypothetical protein n=1 Tax=Kitasatospora sp. NPDC094016 TaxID=3154986 RepID=UPI003327CB0E